MLTTQQVTDLIKAGSNASYSLMFEQLIIENEPRAKQMKLMFDNYKGEKLKIKQRPDRQLKSVYKANNKIPNDYRGIIIDEAIDYTFGKPVTVSVTTETGKDEEGNDVAQPVTEAVNVFRMLNSLPDLDITTALYQGCCGYGARLLYIDKESKVRVANRMPWEVIIIYNASTNEVEYGMLYYEMTKVWSENGLVKERTFTRVEWYDEVNVTFFVDNGDFKFVKDTPEVALTESNNPLPHNFDGVPLVKYKNNDVEKGDFEKVVDLIDGYDVLISDNQNELEDYRNAYLKFKGMKADKEFMKELRETGAINCGDEKSDVEWLVKELNDTFTENQKKSLNSNIYKFSKRVDFDDEKFSGAEQSGESRKWKIFALEMDASMKERKFTAADREMYRLFFSVEKKRKNKEYSSLDLQFTYVRNLPLDLDYYAGVMRTLYGVVPTKILYSLMPFIENVNEALDLKKEEDNEFIDLDEPFLNSDDGAMYQDNL
ncbi:MAG: phage portal protein [PVC group bacterium]|nr:phage portal protein [PVC group bacterium]